MICRVCVVHAYHTQGVFYCTNMWVCNVYVYVSLALRRASARLPTLLRYAESAFFLPRGLYAGREETFCVHLSARFTRSLIDERITNPSAIGSLLRNSSITCLSFVLSSFKRAPSEHSYVVKRSMTLRVILAFCASFFRSLTLFCVNMYKQVC